MKLVTGILKNKLHGSMGAGVAARSLAEVGASDRSRIEVILTKR
jgi:hypothetical protein